MADGQDDQPVTPESVNRFLKRKNGPASSRLLGVHCLAVDAEAGTIRIGFNVGPELTNGMGTIQGGFVAAMLDEALSLAIIAAQRFTIWIPTLELKVSYLRPVLPGTSYAEGMAVKQGRRIAFLEGRLFADDGTLLATASATAIPVPRTA